MSTQEATETVWKGADALRAFLVPVDSLEPHPGNPRRGDVQAVVDSLRRFGQTRPVLTHGTRTIAGHHVRQAAINLGWTHVAAISNEFANEDEARAYLLADNRTHDLGPGYDPQLLVDQLRFLDEYSTLQGTGYSRDDLDDLLAEMLRADANIMPPPPAPPRASVDLTEVVLLFSAEQHEQFAAWTEQAASRFGTAGVSETAYEALRAAAGG